MRVGSDGVLFLVVMYSLLDPATGTLGNGWHASRKAIEEPGSDIEVATEPPLSQQQQERQYGQQRQPPSLGLPARSAGKGEATLVGTSIGPRPPANEREEKWAKIPEYRAEEHLLNFAHTIKTSGTSLSLVLQGIFGKAVVPTSHPSGSMKLDALRDHDEEWWEPYQVMYGHNGCDVVDQIGIPPSKKPKLLLVVRNPLLHKASIYFETVCHYGKHIHDGAIDQEEATVARMKGDPVSKFEFCRDAELWVESEQFAAIWRDLQARTYAYQGEKTHPCIHRDVWAWPGSGEDPDGSEGEQSCDSLKARGEHGAILEEHYDQLAESAIRRMEEALWVGVTERSDEADCLLFLTLGKGSRDMGSSRHKEPRPISVWHDKAISKATLYDKADWKVFNAANDMLDLRIWTARERLLAAGEEELERLGTHCVDILRGSNT
ncbi:unnamed protein product [Scytosiphon promiscuus]